MGGGGYSVSSSMTRRHTKSETTGNTVFTASQKELFPSTKVHQSLDPKGVEFRECRDNDDHPEAIPLQIYLDVTGSMMDIPMNFMRDGLPTMMGTILQAGVPDVALMFGAIGDHECDRAPLQIGQFEASDELVDQHLKNTFLEGGGGGNSGESYALAWNFAGNHVRTDAWEKREEKGFLFTIGDEPFLPNYPKAALKNIHGSAAKAQDDMTANALLELAQERNHVFHIHVNHGRSVNSGWTQLLGDNLLQISDFRDIPKLIATTILGLCGDKCTTPPTQDVDEQIENAPKDVKINL